MGRGRGHDSTLHGVAMPSGAMTSQPVFALVDVNNFYVSCERVLR